MSAGAPGRRSPIGVGPPARGLSRLLNCSRAKSRRALAVTIPADVSGDWSRSPSSTAVPRSPAVTSTRLSAARETRSSAGDGLVAAGVVDTGRADSVSEELVQAGEHRTDVARLGAHLARELPLRRDLASNEAQPFTQRRSVVEHEAAVPRREPVECIVQFFDVVVVHGLEVDPGDRDHEVAWQAERIDLGESGECDLFELGRAVDGGDVLLDPSVARRALVRSRAASRSSSMRWTASTPRPSMGTSSRVSSRSVNEMPLGRHENSTILSSGTTKGGLTQEAVWMPARRAVSCR